MFEDTSGTDIESEGHIAISPTDKDLIYRGGGTGALFDNALIIDYRTGVNHHLDLSADTSFKKTTLTQINGIKTLKIVMLTNSPEAEDIYPGKHCLMNHGRNGVHLYYLKDDLNPELERSFEHILSTFEFIE